MPVPRSSSNKSIRDKILRRIITMITLHHYGRRHPILAVAMIHHDLQQVGINLEYENVLS
jgi:hypothetical protein